MANLIYGFFGAKNFKQNYIDIQNLPRMKLPK